LTVEIGTRGHATRVRFALTFVGIASRRGVDSRSRLVGCALVTADLLVLPLTCGDDWRALTVTWTRWRRGVDGGSTVGRAHVASSVDGGCSRSYEYVRVGIRIQSDLYTL